MPDHQGGAVARDHRLDELPAEYAASRPSCRARRRRWAGAFVKRRRNAELGADWETKFKSFEHHPAAAASLGQVHRAHALDGSELACKLQYPDMQSAVEADLSQLQLLFSIRKRFDPALDTTEIAKEIAERLREELDYVREAKHVALYRHMLKDEASIRVPDVWPELSTGRLLTMDWLTGDKLLEHKDDALAVRNRLATAMFTAWWHPFSQFGVIHGDPHLGNYTAFEMPRATGRHQTARLWPHPHLPAELRRRRGRSLSRPAQRRRRSGGARLPGVGLQAMNRELIEALNIWARFIYGPLLDDRVRTIADGVKPSEYGRKQAFQVHQALKKRGPVMVPREFVFMDRAAIGWRGIFAPGGGTQFPSLVQRGHRTFLD